MAVTSVYPVLMSADVSAAADFYRDVLGFMSTFASDWYVSLRREGFELAIVAHDHPTIPEAHRRLPQGIIVNLEVDDVDHLHDLLVVRGGLVPERSLRDEDFGQRHFIVAAPDGVLVDIIQPIPPTASFADAYASN